MHGAPRSKTHAIMNELIRKPLFNSVAREKCVSTRAICEPFLLIVQDAQWSPLAAHRTHLRARGHARFTVPPRAHPSTGSQSGSAAPVLPQVPSTRSRGLLNYSNVHIPNSETAVSVYAPALTLHRARSAILQPNRFPGFSKLPVMCRLPPFRQALILSEAAIATIAITIAIAPFSGEFTLSHFVRLVVHG